MRSFKTTLMMTIAGTAMVAASAPAFAQDADEDDIDIVVSSGTRISAANVVSTSPVTTLSDEAFTRQGVIDAVDVLNTLPSVTPAQDSNVSNGATGTSSVNLRGLGSNRNLILVDGKRLAPGRPDISSSDLNQVPTPLLERVEVVTGGASAVYGSDAIAGVVNFILDRDFEGFEADANFSFFWDGNSNSFAQDVTDQSSTDGITPSDTQTDGETIDLWAKFGTGFGDGKGSMVGYVRYVDQGEVLQGTRDVSRCAIVDFGPQAGNDVFCVGSNFGPFPTTVTLPAIQGGTGFSGVISLDSSG
ncbi:MAG: TonB-dependent receptor plug domain-containing protein, partial [Pseudomonadota bacterium]